MRDEHIAGQQEHRGFFISYTDTDRQWAEWIALQLEEAKYTTIIQAWDSRRCHTQCCIMLHIGKA